MALDNFLERTAGFEEFLRKTERKPFGEKSALDKFSDLMTESQAPGSIAAENKSIDTENAVRESALAQLPQAPAQPETPFRETILGGLTSAFVPGARGVFDRQEQSAKRSALANIMKDPSISPEQKISALAQIDIGAAQQLAGIQSTQQQGQLTREKIVDLKAARKQGAKVPETKGLPSGFMWQKDASGQLKAVRVPGLEDIEDIKPETIEGEQKLRKEFTGEIKEFKDVNRSFARIKASAANPSPAGDLALVFNFMKMLDPGSVVRESEFRTAATAKPLLEKIGLSGDAAESFILGKKLTSGQRADFLKRANDLFIPQKQIAEESKRAFDSLATEYGFKPERVTATFQAIKEGGEDKPLTDAEQAELQALEAELGQ